MSKGERETASCFSLGRGLVLVFFFVQTRRPPSEDGGRRVWNFLSRPALTSRNGEVVSRKRADNTVPEGRIRGPVGLDKSSMEESREAGNVRSEEHTSELQSLMRISYAVFFLKKKK